MNKILTASAIFLLIGSVYGQEPLDVNTYASKYPGEPVIYLQQDADINMEVKKGGKRKGAGRKKANYQTKTIAFRVRVEWVEPIKKMVKDYVSEQIGRAHV